jgi:N-acetylneuraminic acid mutarotase
MVVAVLLSGLPPAVAATAESGGGAAAQTTEPSIQPVCQVPQPGRVGCFALRRSESGTGRAALSAASAPDGYGAADLQSAYGLPADGGEGRTVAIVVADDDPTAESDLAVYRAQYGLPECTTANGCFRKIDQRGGTDYPQPNASWAGEASLDMDMVSAAAPAAHILLVEADSTVFEDMFAAVDQAVAQGAQYVSNSYGADYSSTSGSGEFPEETTEFDAHFNHPGVAMVASSGDFGYGVTYPAASRYVTAVVGTTLTRSTTTSRGWAESAWYATGSGCSVYEPKPGFQTDTGCAGRTVGDVAAVADPRAGVAVYQTYGDSGWGVMGGTSASAPLIAGVYAAAGAPGAGTYPNSYPYFKPSALNDVTSGTNGTCTPAYLCTAGAGYDAPTGLGSPNGLAAFRSYPHGTVSGTVTGSGGTPLTSATVSADGYQVPVDSHGRYSLTLPPGSYDLRADAYGYRTGTVAAVTVADGDSITQDISLDAAATQTVTGRVTDGSGHGYPLYAAVTAEDVPGAPVFTNPYTGTYKLNLPQGHDYTLKIVPQYPGYRTVTKDISVGSSTARVDAAVPVDPDTDTFAGYDVASVGRTEAFEDGTAPEGWSVVNADGTTGGWVFSNPGHRPNTTGGSGGLAVADSLYFGNGKRQDSSLVSPVYDFSDYARPRLSFDSNFLVSTGQSGTVDITADGGATWTTLRTFGPAQVGHIEVPIGAYAGDKAVQVRFRYLASYNNYWELDNVFIGDHPATPVAGGLVAGVIKDANTGGGVPSARIRNADGSGQVGLTVATPDDPQLDDGFYWLFSGVLGKQSFTVTKSRFTTGSMAARVVPDGMTESDRSLQAGQLTIKQAAVDRTLGWDGRATAKVTIKNTGKAPAGFTVAEQAGGPEAPTPPVDGAAWQSVANLPVATLDNAVAADGGRLYSAFGYTSANVYNANMYVYDPDTDAWSQRASAADARDAVAKGFIDGKFYAVGGWRNDGTADPNLEIYDPASDTWTTGAPTPKPYAASGSAVVDGRLYVVGGCVNGGCGSTDVYAYDPRTDRWSQMAAYPEPISWNACGEIAGKLYCAGGLALTGSATKHSYVYDPVTDSWSPIADAPLALWQTSYAAANGRLVTVGGKLGAGVTNKSFAYEPQAGTWTALPNAPTPVYRGGAAPGFYSVGGRSGPYVYSPPVATVSVLPGYDQGDRVDDVSWLGLRGQRATLPPGASTTVTVSLDATVSDITQPGDYAAQLAVETDTPYHMAPIPVTMTVQPRKGWGRYAGTVLGDDGAGGTTPLAGAAVQLVGKESTHTVTTGEDGTFALWLDARGGPLTVTVSMEGYASATTRVKLVKGRSTAGDFTLRQAP